MQSSAFLIADCIRSSGALSARILVSLSIQGTTWTFFKSQAEALNQKLRALGHPNRRRLNLHKCFDYAKSGCIANGSPDPHAVSL
jgi:hypothetical protein